MTDTGTEGGADQSEIDEEEEEDNSQATISNAAAFHVKSQPNLDSLSGLREIGDEAVCWRLSSAKPGNGVDQIRNNSHGAYWQSDGTTQPHWIQIHFSKRVAVSHVAIYLDYQLDESYTPKQIRVLYGVTTQDMLPALYPPNTTIETQEPKGWCIIPLSSPPDPLDFDEEEHGQDFVKGFVFRIVILAMHQNGRDTHIRNVKIFSKQPKGGNAMLPRPIRLTHTEETELMNNQSENEDDDWMHLPSSLEFMSVR